MESHWNNSTNHIEITEILLKMEIFVSNEKWSFLLSDHIAMYGVLRFVTGLIIKVHIGSLHLS
jgi:hypothetical protein